MSNDDKAAPAFPNARANKIKATKSLWLLGGLGIIACLAAGGVFSALTGYVRDQVGQTAATGYITWIFVALLAALIAIVVVHSMKLWRSLDEMSRSLHSNAFLLGVSLAWIPLTAIALLPIKVRGFSFDVIEQLNISASAVFGWGLLTALFVTCTGYGIAWLLMWNAKR